MSDEDSKLDTVNDIVDFVKRHESNSVGGFMVLVGEESVNTRLFQFNDTNMSAEECVGHATVAFSQAVIESVGIQNFLLYLKFVFEKQDNVVFLTPDRTLQ